MADDPIRRLIEKMRNDPEQKQMWAELAERTRRIREKYAGVDVVTLDEIEWQEWLSVHHIFEQDKAKGRRQNHRYQMKMAARAERLRQQGIQNEPDGDR